jgi:arylsulfatase A-like enzyme
MFNSSRWAEDVTPEAIRWLKQNGRQNNKPFFMWVHYFDPHSPYEFREHFANLKQNGSTPPFVIADPDMSERVRNYDTEIAYTDWHIGKLLAELDEMKLSDSTLVVLTADHGESLGEHDYVGHGRHLYENIIRIPLVVRWPGKVKAGQVVSTPVSIVDIAPTVLDLTVKTAVHKSKVPVKFVGRTLAPALTTGAKLPERRIYSVTFPGKKGFAPRWISWLWVRDEELPLKFGYIDGNSKVIWSPEEQKAVAYDVGRDPQEAQPRTLNVDSQSYRRQTERLKTWFARTESRASEEKMTARDAEILKSLGYVQ